MYVLKMPHDMMDETSGYLRYEVLDPKTQFSSEYQENIVYVICWNKYIKDYLYIFYISFTVLKKIKQEAKK